MQLIYAEVSSELCFVADSLKCWQPVFQPPSLLGLSVNAHFLFRDVGHCGERGQVSVFSWCHLDKKNRHSVHSLTPLQIVGVYNVTGSPAVDEELQEAGQHEGPIFARIRIEDTHGSHSGGSFISLYLTNDEQHAEATPVKNSESGD